MRPLMILLILMIPAVGCQNKITGPKVAQFMEKMAPSVRNLAVSYSKRKVDPAGRPEFAGKVCFYLNGLQTLKFSLNDPRVYADQGRLSAEIGATFSHLDQLDRLVRGLSPDVLQAIQLLGRGAVATSDVKPVDGLTFTDYSDTGEFYLSLVSPE